MTCVHRRALHVLLCTPAGGELMHQVSMPLNKAAGILALQPAAGAADSRMRPAGHQPLSHLLDSLQLIFQASTWCLML